MCAGRDIWPCGVCVALHNRGARYGWIDCLIDWLIDSLIMNGCFVIQTGNRCSSIDLIWLVVLVIELANDSQYGLSATIWTTNSARANRVALELEVCGTELIYDSLRDCLRWSTFDSFSLFHTFSFVTMFFSQSHAPCRWALFGLIVGWCGIWTCLLEE